MTKRSHLLVDYMTALPYSIGVDQPLTLARDMMRKHRIRHLPVLHGAKLVGVVSDRDIALIEALRDVDPAKVQVEEAMTPEPYAATASTPLATVVREMADNKYGCAVIQEGNAVIGVFTTTDVCRVLADLLTESAKA